ncbi:MAG TPA: hypothetical protein VNS46_21100 [Nocardioides sp.]|nr:hypothetical protein [Nocardioides sp.]
MLSPGLLTSWRDRALVATVLALFVVPAVILLVGPRPARFGFQMYSGYGSVSATWQDGAGEQHAVDLADHLANDRSEVDWPTFLPEELCRRIPAAVRVEVRRTQPGGDEHRSVAC